jgi:transcriptional regulator with XRE-family HTH domain
MPCGLGGIPSALFIAFHEIVKQEFSKQMSFGSRLAEERKRLGLKQADFADLVGTDVPKQSLYENDRRELRADYLARLADAEVDIVYVLTGRRSEGEWLGQASSDLLSAYLSLPPDLQDALAKLTFSLRDQFTRPSGATLHARRQDYKTDRQPR